MLTFNFFLFLNKNIIQIKTQFLTFTSQNCLPNYTLNVLMCTVIGHITRVCYFSSDDLNLLYSIVNDIFTLIKCSLM